jgi:hypothetical protein
MGLDNYALRGPDRALTAEEQEFESDENLERLGFKPLSDEDIEAFEEADIHLSGGVLSGEDGSFRGKVYDLLVQDITGESLYQEWIPPGRVKKMYEALMKCDPKEGLKGKYAYNLNESSIISLRKFFKVCAERNLGLVGWS